MQNVATCSIEGCEATASRVGQTLCRSHDHRQRRYGSPLGSPRSRVAPGAVERWCSGCDKVKPLSEFGPKKTRCRPCEARIAREQRANATPEQRERRLATQRRSWVKAAYGEAGLAADARIQNGAGCDVCGQRTQRMAIDHDHDTGEVRGILCKDCNLVLGWMNDDPQRLRALATYLEGDDRG